MKIKPISIGKLRLESNILLAPMVDITDLPYRLICKKSGASMTYTEMLYTSQIIHENQKTLRLLKTNKKESPVGLQITGNNIEEFKKIIPYAKNFDLVDINCGCPSNRIVGNEAGSYLLKDPEKIANIIKELKSTGLTVTAKIRLGFKKNNALEIAKMIEKAGADAITVHARLASQGRNIPAQWNEIKKVKQTVNIPVIGNGDIFTPEDAKSMLEKTGCDGVMIARGAIGNPLIFKQIIDYFKTGEYEKNNLKSNLDLFTDYIQLSKKYETLDISRIKYLGTKFIKGFKGSGKERQKLMQSTKIEEIESLIKKLS